METNKTSKIPTHAEYEQRERQMVFAKLDEVKNAPLSDRREARKDFAKALRNPALVAERISWLIDGNYGYGLYIMARELLEACTNSRRKAYCRTILCQWIAAHEWQCPAPFALQAWKALSLEEKDALSAAVDREIDAFRAPTE
jgi:hypothetical protein